MGLWTWIVDNWLSEDGESAKHAPKEPGYVRSSRGGVALAEPPEPNTDLPSESPWWKPEGATLLEPVEVKRPDLSGEARALENLLVSHFDGHDLSLPPLLHIAETLLPKLVDKDCDMKSIAIGIGEDQVIAAAVLRMANSPLYRGLNRIKTLQPATCRLGLRALRTLLMHESLRSAMFIEKGGNSEWARRIWRRSLASASIMRGVSDFCSVDKEDAFLIGLLHDIGNVIVLRVVCRARSTFTYEIDDDTFNYLCHECHQEFGELIADSWSLPPHLKAIISSHHTYPAADDEFREQRLLVHITGMINSLLGYAPFAPFDLLESRAVKDLGLDGGEDFVTFLETLGDEVYDTVEAL